MLIQENYVDNCYQKEAYMAVYSYPILAMLGPEDWPHSDFDSIFLPTTSHAWF
ncbi:hypothetical protein CJ030_MR6G027706 [Morella rubra]|uniref:Uncharacterized protein n=1 Tax=Morella rubra TaxID=262757 RepID=A0A6A1VC98_9ROSI|nr:hypothetical protein CJ030_MR6G027706 [Morella rubra]